MKKIPFESFRLAHRPETLATGSIFGAISTEATEFLLINGNIYMLQKDEVLFQSGEKVGSFFVVCKGKLGFHKHRGEHTFMTRTVAFGEEVGFVPMIALHDHAGHAVALEDTTVLEISAGLFSELHQQYPLDFGLMLMNLARDMARIVIRLSDTLVEANSWKNRREGESP